MREDRTPPSRDAPGVAQAGICRTGLVFIDETAVKMKLTRRRERAPVGERPCGAAPGPALGPDTGEGALLADTRRFIAGLTQNAVIAALERYDTPALYATDDNRERRRGVKLIQTGNDGDDPALPGNRRDPIRAGRETTGIRKR